MTPGSAGGGRKRPGVGRETPDEEAWDPLDPDRSSLGSDGERGQTNPGGFFPELIRRGLTLGFTGVFMTEEALRRALGDSVPRDVVEFLTEQTERTRNEFLERLSREFGRVLQAVDPAEVARRLLEGQTIELTTKIRLLGKEQDGNAKDGSEDAP